MKKILIGLSLLILTTLAVSFAHGSNITYTSMTSYQLHGAFDDGTPMSGAQVIVFSPDNPENPWFTGLADDDGNYLFVPPLEIQGDWTIQFRSAGHGDMVSINTTNDSSSQVANMSYLQKGIVGIAILWGFIGTSLYFRKKAN